MRLIIIDKESDLTIEVVEYDEDTCGGDSDKKIVKEKVQFLVKRDTLITHSPVLSAMLQRDNWKESSQDTIELTECIKRLEVCLKVLHKTARKTISSTYH